MTFSLSMIFSFMDLWLLAFLLAAAASSLFHLAASESWKGKRSWLFGSCVALATHFAILWLHRRLFRILWPPQP